MANSSQKTYKLAVIPGDGIGNEIVPMALKTMEKAAEMEGFQLDKHFFPYGASYYKNHGTFMPEGAMEELKGFDALLFGAVGLPEVDDTLPAKEYTFKVRTEFEQYVNYRPVKFLPGIPSPLRDKHTEDVDFVIIRENTEGEFVLAGKILRPESKEGLATQTSIFTRKGIERIAHFSFKLARKRRKLVTNVTKSNTLIHSLAYWDSVVAEVAQQYPDVDYRKMYVDNAAASFVLRPEIFDVVLTTNMIGDILSDLGGAIMGSLGLGPSGNLNPEKDFPSMFEPIHGSAPDIAGKGIANPIGTIWSGALLLEHIGEAKAAQLIIKAIETVCQQGMKTTDLGGSSSTEEITEAILSEMGKLAGSYA